MEEHFEDAGEIVALAPRHASPPPLVLPLPVLVTEADFEFGVFHLGRRGWKRFGRVRSDSRSG